MDGGCNATILAGYPVAKRERSDNRLPTIRRCILPRSGISFVAHALGVSNLCRTGSDQSCPHYYVDGNMPGRLLLRGWQACF